LVAALGASGCKEDDDNPPADSGGPGPVDSGGGGSDAGAVDSGPKDSGPAADSAAEAAVAVMCGTPPKTCEPHTIPGLPVIAAGCATNAADAEVCGISSQNVLMGADPKFMEKDAPGVPSASCGALIDSNEPTPDGGVVDGGTKGNGMIDTTTTILGTIMVALRYPGCCTKDGFCSTDGMNGMSSVAGAAYNPSNNGYGCANPKYIFKAQGAAAQNIPCDPVTGALKLPTGDGGAGDAGDAGDSGPSDAGADGGNG
jgi:hypothetical protein